MSARLPSTVFTFMSVYILTVVPALTNYRCRQIMPSTNKAKAVFDNVKTTSYHIKSVVNCSQSTKSSSIFKLVVSRDGGNKRYDFEAESPKLASEFAAFPSQFLVSLGHSIARVR
jgi:SAPK-interacting protein 1 (Sin1), Pleckstrin-homology